MDLLGKSVVRWSLVLALGSPGCDKKEDRADEAPAEASTKPADAPPQPQPIDPSTDPITPPPPGDEGATAPPPPDPETKDPASDPRPGEPDADAEPKVGGADEGLGGDPPRPMRPDDEDDEVDWGVSFAPDQGTLILSFEADAAVPGTPSWCMDPERVLDRIEAAVKDHERCSIEKKFSLQQGGGFSYVCRSPVPDKPSCALSFAARLKIKRRGNSEVDYRIFGTADITRECSGSEAPFEPRREDIVAASTKGATGRLEEIVEQCSKRGTL